MLPSGRLRRPRGADVYNRWRAAPRRVNLLRDARADWRFAGTPTSRLAPRGAGRATRRSAGAVRRRRRTPGVESVATPPTFRICLEVVAANVRRRLPRRNAVQDSRSGVEVHHQVAPDGPRAQLVDRMEGELCADTSTECWRPMSISTSTLAGVVPSASISACSARPESMCRRRSRAVDGDSNAHAATVAADHSGDRVDVPILTGHDDRDGLHVAASQAVEQRRDRTSAIQIAPATRRSGLDEDDAGRCPRSGDGGGHHVDVAHHQNRRDTPVVERSDGLPLRRSTRQDGHVAVAGEG